MAPAPKNISVPGLFCSCFPATGRVLHRRLQCRSKVHADCRLPDAGCSDSAIQRFSDSAIQRFSDSAIQRFSDSAIQRFSDVPMSRCPDVPMSRCPDVPMSRCPNAPTPRRPDAPTPRRPDAPTPRRPDASTSFAPRVFSQGRVSTHCPCGVRFSDHPVLQHADINHVVALINETSKRHC